MDEGGVPTTSRKAPLMILISVVVLLLLGLVSFFYLKKPGLVSPLPEGDEVRVIFVTPAPSTELATESATLASPSATPKTTATPKVTPKASPVVTPSATSSASPAT